MLTNDGYKVCSTSCRLNKSYWRSPKIWTFSKNSVFYCRLNCLLYQRHGLQAVRRVRRMKSSAVPKRIYHFVKPNLLCLRSPWDPATLVSNSIIAEVTQQRAVTTARSSTLKGEYAVSVSLPCYYRDAFFAQAVDDDIFPAPRLNWAHASWHCCITILLRQPR